MCASHKLDDGKVSTIAAIGRLNPVEFSNLLPDAKRLLPLSEAAGGGLFPVGPEGPLPQVQQIKEGRSSSDSLGLVNLSIFFCSFCVWAERGIEKANRLKGFLA